MTSTRMGSRTPASRARAAGRSTSTPTATANSARAKPPRPRLADGSYSFNGLAAGTYTVAEVQQLGWQQTSPVGTAPAIERVSVADDGTQAKQPFLSRPTLSADGRYVAFDSSASNLVPGDTNGVSDVFVYDRQTDTIERVSVAADGTQGNGKSYSRISADGRYVAFSLLPATSSPAIPMAVTRHLRV